MLFLNVVKKVALVSLVTMTAFGGQAFAAKSVTLKTPDGDTERIRKVDISDKEVRRDLEKLGVDFATNRELCGNKPLSESASMRKVELQLELNFIIQSLKRSDSRRLSAAHQEIVNRAPACDPFLTELVTIAKLTKGWQLVKVEN